MKSPSYWINNLNLRQHPEGGYYKEMYRSSEAIPASSLPARFPGDRNFSTAIYFLLQSKDRSLFHRIKSDELWFYHAGCSLTIYVLANRELTTHKLGPDIEKGESLQAVIPANSWFGAIVNEPDGYTLSSCTVSPGFDFEDFELANGDSLCKEYTHHADIIRLLTA